MARTVIKRWLGPKRTAREVELGFWEWYAYLFEENGNYYIGRALGNPDWGGGVAPYNEIGGPKTYPTEEAALKDFLELQSPESGNKLTCPRCSGTYFTEVDCGPDTHEDDIFYLSSVCDNCGLWHSGWTGKWLVDVRHWLDENGAEEYTNESK